MMKANRKHDSWVMWLTGLFTIVAFAVFAFAIVRHKRIRRDELMSETTAVRAVMNAPITGEFSVVRVHDGDTLTLIGTDGLEISVRLCGIDAPELGQPYGFEAKHALQMLLKGHAIRLSNPKKGKYGRYVADVYVGDMWINKTMVATGNAWCDQVNSFNRLLYSAEQKAKARGIGLWALPTPEPPWIWRAERK